MSDHPLQTASIDTLLRSMETYKASDLFLCVGKAPTLRVHGQIVPLDYAPSSEAQLADLKERVLGAEARRRFDAEGEIDIGYNLDGQHRFRINLSRQQGLLSAVLRALPSGALSFAELGLPEQIPDLLTPLRGMVMVTGATGSGKSTTLAAMVHHINQNLPVHVVTVEDPIEFLHNDLVGRITQREVGSDTASFRNALRQVVRQSPDVILIGEMRDRDTMQVALSAALTGHMVLTSLHTMDTSQTLQRILSYFPEHLRDQAALDLSLALRVVLSQRLVPMMDGTGRIPAVEMLTNTPAAKRLLREQRIQELTDLVRTSAAPGMLTFNESLLNLYRHKKISYETGLASATNPEEFTLWTKGMSTGVHGFRGDGRGARTKGLDLKVLLARAMELGASDLHLAASRPPIVRLAGELRKLGERVLSDGDMRMLLRSVMNARQRETYELEREVDFALAVDDGRRFRVNAYFQRGRMAAALRAIPQRIPDAQTLGIPEPVLLLGERPTGLLLVVGPTGSGKSTTLACLLDRINSSRTCRVITIEDPIEYVHQSRKATVDQREVFADTSSFSAALKFILRQDPDVIMVGEMRDAETISAALTAAETGHLVMSTLHTNDAVQAIDRVVDVFPPHQQPQVRSQLSACLLGVVSQRLLAQAGARGRIAAFEVLVANTAIRTLIRENKMHQAYGLMEASRRDGCTTMDQALQTLYAERKISYEDALRYLRNPKSIRPEEPPPAEGAEPAQGQQGYGQQRPGQQSYGQNRGQQTTVKPVSQPEQPKQPRQSKQRSGRRFPWQK